MESALKAIDLHSLQSAHDKLGWMPPDCAEIIAHLSGSIRLKGRALDIKPNIRDSWIQALMRIDSFDGRQQAQVFATLRSEIGDWLDFYARGGDRPRE